MITVRIEVGYDDGRTPQSFAVTGTATSGDVAGALTGAYQWAQRVLAAAEPTPASTP